MCWLCIAPLCTSNNSGWWSPIKLTFCFIFCFSIMVRFSFYLEWGARRTCMMHTSLHIEHSAESRHRLFSPGIIQYAYIHSGYEHVKSVHTCKFKREMAKERGGRVYKILRNQYKANRIALCIRPSPWHGSCVQVMPYVAGGSVLNIMKFAYPEVIQVTIILWGQLSFFLFASIPLKWYFSTEILIADLSMSFPIEDHSHGQIKTAHNYRNAKTSWKVIEKDLKCRALKSLWLQQSSKRFWRPWSTCTGKEPFIVMWRWTLPPHQKRFIVHTVWPP